MYSSDFYHIRNHIARLEDKIEKNKSKRNTTACKPVLAALNQAADAIRSAYMVASCIDFSKKGKAKQ